MNQWLRQFTGCWWTALFSALYQRFAEAETPTMAMCSYACRRRHKRMLAPARASPVKSDESVVLAIYLLLVLRVVLCALSTIRAGGNTNYGDVQLCV